MIEQVLLNRENAGISSQETAQILMKLANISEGNFRKRLLLFLLKHSDKKDTMYGDVCVSLTSTGSQRGALTFEESL